MKKWARIVQIKVIQLLQKNKRIRKEIKLEASDDPKDDDVP